MAGVWLRRLLDVINASFRMTTSRAFQRLMVDFCQSHRPQLPSFISNKQALIFAETEKLTA
jgi:hypothetical protein